MGVTRLVKSRFKMLPYEYLKWIPRYSETTVSLLGQKFRIADSLSFYYSFQEIFLHGIYKFHSSGDDPTILDCGSNYGTSIVFFKSIYPNSKIIGVEADPKIFKLLEWNVAHREYEDVDLINRALSVSSAPVTFFHEGADGGRIHPINGGDGEKFEVGTVHIDDLIQGHVDFLKMDIEGAETEVICSSEKLDMVDQLFIEYHSFRTSGQTLHDILEVLSSSGFRYYIHTKFCSPRPLVEDRLQLGMDLQLNIFAKRDV